jgi:nucleoid-associated protein YgaU
MSVQAKYQKALNFAASLNVADGKIVEENGVLKMWGTVQTAHEKDQIWDAIHADGGKNPSDVVADIKVANPNVYAVHTVAPGESLSKIAKHYYGDMMKYNEIFAANRDQLKSADAIEVGQVLTIPVV